jgi:hypothetical protein
VVAICDNLGLLFGDQLEHEIIGKSRDGRAQDFDGVESHVVNGFVC